MNPDYTSLMFKSNYIDQLSVTDFALCQMIG
jgi:hypothetical protein